VHINGYQNTVAVSGTALTDNQLSLLKRFTKNLYFCLDMDDAGLRALDRGVSLAIPMGFNIKVITLEGVKDPDEAFAKDSELFANAIADASDYFDFLINHEFLNFDTKKRSDSLFVKNFVNRYLDTVRLLPEEFLKDFYLRRLSKVTGLSFLNLQKSLVNIRPTAVGSNVSTQKVVKKAHKYTVEDLFWTYVFMKPSVIESLQDYNKIMELCLTQNQLYKDIILNYNANDFDNYIVPEIYKVKSLELESGGLDVDRFDFNSEVVKLLLRMKQNYRKSRLSEIKMKLNNCSAKEQLQLLSQYKNLMSL
jgi:DNA primase